MIKIIEITIIKTLIFLLNNLIHVNIPPPPPSLPFLIFIIKLCYFSFFLLFDYFNRILPIRDSTIFFQIFTFTCFYPHTHTHTHKRIYIYLCHMSVCYRKMIKAFFNNLSSYLPNSFIKLHI